MNLWKWAEGKIKKLSLWDFAMVKIALGLLGVIIGAYISTFIKQYVWYFVAVFVVLYGLLMYKVFRKN